MQVCKINRIALFFFSPQGLQELASLVPGAREEELCAFLPFWPKHFSKSALDYDRRLREASQVAHLRIVTRLKKQVSNCGATVV
jgi:hypothetical protein